MTKIEQLSQWVTNAIERDQRLDADGVAATDDYNKAFAVIGLAHALMPQVLEAVEALRVLRGNLSQYDDGEWYLHEGCDTHLDRVDTILEKLK